MKKTLLSARTLFIIVLIGLFQVSFSQISIVSTTGYAVNIDANPIAIVPNSTSCTWGYNYTVKVRYTITITGNNKPSSLYTMQGTVGCGSTTSFFDLPNGAGSGTVNSSNAWNGQSNCNTVTVASMGCNTMNIQISGPGINYREVSFQPSQTVLSVKLVSFTAELAQNKVKLNWATGTETDNDYFTIERSANGTDWNEVKTVDGAGNSNSVLNYEAYDESPLTGTSYYRLKQTDFDGQKSYSDIQMVKYSPLTKGVSLYPVPNNGNTVNISGITDYKNHNITVLNAAGNILYATTLSKSSVDLPSLQPGLYIIRLADKISGSTQSLRYVKI